MSPELTQKSHSSKMCFKEHPMPPLFGEGKCYQSPLHFVWPLMSINANAYSGERKVCERDFFLK